MMTFLITDWSPEMYSDATNLMVCDEKEVESAGVPGGLKVSFTTFHILIFL